MTTATAARRVLVVLTLAAFLGLPCTAVGGSERGAALREASASAACHELGSRSADTTTAMAFAGKDPRLHRAGPRERTLREVGDAVFVRPILFVRLVAGSAMLPVALPIAALFADWHDALDICVTGPYDMVFRRTLGE